MQSTVEADRSALADAVASPIATQGLGTLTSSLSARAALLLAVAL